MSKISELYDFQHTLAGAYLKQFTYPWEVLDGIGSLILSLEKEIRENGEACCGYRELAPGVWVHETAKIASTACLGAPCILGANTEVRHGAFIRGNALVGESCVVGNSTELKNVILFDEVQVPHYNYVGDSILGYKAHMGAGAVTSNVRSDKAFVVVHADMQYFTNRKKVGAFLGDFAEVGCNSVLNPGTVVGRNSQVYPTSCVRGVVPENSIYKRDGIIVQKR